MAVPPVVDGAAHPTVICPLAGPPIAVGLTGALGRAKVVAESTPVRLGYVSWLPDGIESVLNAAVSLRLDEWVLPSHVQADRVAEGTLDVALTWVSAQQAASRRLTTHLLRAEP